jgi:integrase
MSYVARDDSGAFRVRWRESGKHRTSKRFDRKAEAAAFQRSLDAKAAAEEVHDGVAPIPWAELVKRYLKSRGDATKPYLDEMELVLTRLAAGNGWRFAHDVMPQAAESLPSHQRKKLRTLMRFAVEQGQRVDARTIPKLKPKTPRRQPQTLMTDARVSELVAAATKWHPADGAIAHLVATYGHRVESLRLLTPEALSARPGWLRLRVKSGDIHEHPLLDATAELLNPLAENAKPGEPFLVGHLGKPWASGSDYATWWHHYVVGSKVDGKVVTPKGSGILDLRRYAITRMMSGTKDPKAVASITGHRTVSLLLNVYARSSEERQRAALAAITAPGLHPAVDVSPTRP